MCYIFVNKYRICKIQRVLTNILQSLQLSCKYIISLANMTVWQMAIKPSKVVLKRLVVYTTEDTSILVNERLLILLNGMIKLC